MTAAKGSQKSLSVTITYPVEMKEKVKALQKQRKLSAACQQGIQNYKE
jgi:hypothetical protein